MADFDFGDIASRYLQKRLDPINQFMNDPGQYLQDRAENSTGVKFNSTATNAGFEMPEMASSQPMAPVDYSLSTPQSRGMNQGPVAPSTWQGQTNEFGGMEEKPVEQPQPQVGGFNQLREGTGPTEIPAGPVSPEVAVQPRPQARPATPAELIAQQESGANPNIGYHYQPNAEGQRASSAYGKYGITAPAYADIQKAAPEFAGRPITSLSQEEQDRAFQIDRANRSKQLQAYGIEPTDANLAAAHFAGAKGLSDYLKTGYVSPQAAAANGGEEKFKKIIDQRLGGQPAPASAAAQGGAVAPSTWQGQTNEFGGMEEKPQAFTGPGLSVGGLNQAHLEALNSKDPKSLFKLAYDPTTSPAIQKMALDNLYNDTNSRKRMADAEMTVDKRLADGDVNGLTKDMNKKGDEGSYLKAILFKRLGLDSLAQQEMEKISPTLTATTLQYNDQNYVAQYDKNGNLRSAINSDTGEKADSSTLLKMAGGSGAMMGFKVASTRQDLENGHTVSVLHNDKTGQIRYRDDVTGKVTDKAPAHMGNVGSKSPEALIHDKATMSANSAMKPMIDANTRAAAAGGAERFTEEQIQAAGAQAYKRINPTGQFGGAYVSGEKKTPPAPAAGGEVPPTTTTTTTTPTTTTAPATTNAPAAGAPKSYAQQVLDGEAAPPSGQSGQRAAVMEQVARLAAEQKKTYDPNLFSMRKKTEDSFTTGKQGDTVRAMNVAIDHLDTLGDASKALKNGQYPIYNKLANLYATNTGQTAPGNFDALKTIVGSEVAKAVAGGATALGDREEVRKEINNAKNPEQLAGIIDKYQRLLGGQMSGLETQYKSGGGKNWDAKINDRTNEVMTKIHGGGKPQALPAPYSDADKEARYQEFLRKRNAGK